MLVKRWLKFGGSRVDPHGYWLSEAVAYVAVATKKYLYHFDRTSAHFLSINIYGSGKKGQSEEKGHYYGS